MVGKKLGILFLVAVILSFLTGYFSQSLLPAFQTGNPSDSFDLITDKIKQNYYYEIDSSDIDQAYIETLFSVVSTYARLNNDPYTRLVASPKSSGSYSEESFIGIGITFTFEGNLLNIEDVNLQSDAFGKIIAGDQIIGILENQTEILFVSLNSPNEVLEKLTGIIGETKTMIVKTGDHVIKEVMIEYKELFFPSVTSLNQLHPNLGYIKINQFNSQIDENNPGTSYLFSQALQAIETEKLNTNSENKTLIIDVRDNPGGALTALHNVGSEDVQPGILQLLLRRNIEKPIFSMIPRNETQALQFFGTRTSSKPYNIAVLVNENSASAAEVLAAALWNSGGYQIYGQPTFGKNVYQNSSRLFEYKNVEYILTYTEGKWFYDDNKDIVSHPIDIHLINQKGIKTLQLPVYHGESSLNQVSNALISYQKYLNYYFDFNETETLRVDGYFDQSTKDAIEAYQTLNGLSITSTLNYETALHIFVSYKEALNDYNNDNQLMELVLELTT